MSEVNPKTAYMREYRKRPEARRRQRVQSQATHRALWRLQQAHSDEYQRYYVQALDELNPPKAAE